MIKPRHLQPGMTIGIVAPASGVRIERDVDRAVRGLEAAGFKVKVGRNVRSRYGFLSAPDARRLSDLHRAFADPSIEGIMCLRGGYGTIRLVDNLDYDLIRENPKVFIGFSDITMLSLAMHKKCKLVTFSGPMASSLFGKTRPSRFGISGFLRTVCHTGPPGSIWQDHPEQDRKFRVIRSGSASGKLTGGNLSLLAASIGTPYAIETKNRIVFLEEVDEKPYSIDRMLSQLLLAGRLSDAAGIVIGLNVPATGYAKGEERAARRPGRQVRPVPSRVPRPFEQAMEDVFYERLRPLGIPVISGLPFGHIDDYATLPFGVNARMDSRTGDLVITESAVI